MLGRVYVEGTLAFASVGTMWLKARESVGDLRIATRDLVGWSMSVGGPPWSLWMDFGEEEIVD
jgi:hypothetical protein